MPSPRVTSLRARLIGLVAVALIPAIGLLLAQGFARHRQDRTDLEARVLNFSRMAAQAQQRRIEGARQLLVALSSHTEILSTEPGACVRAVRTLVQNYGGIYTEIGWADASGRIMCHALEGPEHLTIADRAYFQRPLTTKAFAVGELNTGRISGAHVLGFGHPLMDDEGEVTGVLFANLDVWTLSESLASDAGREDATISIFDRTGALVARSREAEGRLGFRVDDEQLALMRANHEMAEKLQKRDVHLREGQRLEALGRLAGGIAHDFNNLLTVILGYEHSLQDGVPSNSRAAQELGELRTAAERATQLTRQLLAFSRQQILQPKPVLLNDIVTQIESLLRRTLGGDVTLETTLDEGTGTVHADPSQMEQVILNLVINARDAMPGGGAVRIATRNVTHAANGNDDDLAPGDYVELSVTDTGSGMSEETRARIFEPFFTTKGAGGTGLGLADRAGSLRRAAARRA